MGKVSLILGGARSGKSRFAQQMAETKDGALIYIATAEAKDAEMAARIAQHRSDRGPRWTTLECPLDLADAIQSAQAASTTLLVDCLTFWLSNLMLGDHDIAAATARLTLALKTPASDVILVSNEVGQGIVPDNALARRFRDAAGRLHQQLAARADEVWFMIAGCPLRVK